MKTTMTQQEALVLGSLETFRSAIGNADVPLHTFYMFILMPFNGDTTISNLEKHVPTLSHASISRNMAILSGQSKTRQDGGFKLVEGYEDPNDRRFKIFRLTAQGKKLREAMHLRGLKLAGLFHEEG